jgi:hypothetical protein
MASWRIILCTVTSLLLACATAPRREISGYLVEKVRPVADRIEVGEDEAALRLSGPESRYPVYLTGYGFEVGGGAVIVLEVWF